jgi:hypothetical protein
VSSTTRVRFPIALLWVTALMLAPARGQVSVSIELPEEPLRPGDRFEAPIVVSGVGDGVASYALRIQFHPEHLRIEGLAGGWAAPFATAPVSDPQSFHTGESSVTAINAGFGVLPESFELARVRFAVVGLRGGSSAVALDLGHGGGFLGGSFEPLEVVLPEPGSVFNLPLDGVPLDADGDGRLLGLTDGVLVVRYLAGHRGAGLVDRAVSPECEFCTPEQIEAFLERAVGMMDVDGDGNVESGSDGALVLRWLFGFRGQELVRGLLGQECARCDSAAIEAYIQSELR